MYSLWEGRYIGASHGRGHLPKDSINILAEQLKKLCAELEDEISLESEKYDNEYMASGCSI